MRLSLESSCFCDGGGADSDCVSICFFDEGAGEGRKTSSTRARQHGFSVSIETRGRNPKDPTAKAKAKMEAKKLQGQVRKKRAEKEKMEERARLQELGDLIRERGVWQTVETPTQSTPPAVNLPVLAEIETQMEDLDAATVADYIGRHADVVDRVAYMASNLAGGSRKQLRLAALVGKAGARILSKRTGNPSALADNRLEALYRKVEKLESEGRRKDARIAKLEQWSQV